MFRICKKPKAGIRKLFPLFVIALYGMVQLLLSGSCNRTMPHSINAGRQPCLSETLVNKVKDFALIQTDTTGCRLFISHTPLCINLTEFTYPYQQHESGNLIVDKRFKQLADWASGGEGYELPRLSLEDIYADYLFTIYRNTVSDSVYGLNASHLIRDAERQFQATFTPALTPSERPWHISNPIPFHWASDTNNFVPLKITSSDLRDSKNHCLHSYPWWEGLLREYHIKKCKKDALTFQLMLVKIDRPWLRSDLLYLAKRLYPAATGFDEAYPAGLLILKKAKPTVSSCKQRKRKSDYGDKKNNSQLAYVVGYILMKGKK